MRLHQGPIRNLENSGEEKFQIDSFLQEDLSYWINSHRNEFAHILNVSEQKYKIYSFLEDILVTKQK